MVRSEAFRSTLARSGLPRARLLTHDSYLINVSAKDRELRPRTARVIARRLEEVLIDLRADEGPIGLPEYLESVFSDERAARRRKVETGLRILDKRAGKASETDVTTLEPLRPAKRPSSVSALVRFSTRARTNASRSS